jgi:putative CocE/NonD family hydrolase
MPARAYRPVLYSEPVAIATEGTWTRRIVASPLSRTQPRPAEQGVLVEGGLGAPMRDGAQLAGVVWRPAEPGRYPVLVERAPHRPEERTGPAGQYYAARGYAVVGLNLRGCGASGGDFDGASLGAPRGDGYDAVEWAARQPWSNGRVGTICGSISGYTAYQAVVEAAPHLGPAFVRQAAPAFLSYPWSRPTGAVLLSLLQFAVADWTGNLLDRFPPERRAAAERMRRRFKRSKADERRDHYLADPSDPDRRAAVLGVTGFTRRLPLVPHPSFAAVAELYDQLVANAARGRIRSNLQPDVARVQVPVCHLGGWFDLLTVNTIAAFRAMRDRAGNAAARAGQRLVIGPWRHGAECIGQDRVGVLEFGPNARLDYFAFRGRWYDHHLRGERNGVEADPPVWLYVIGPDAWLGCDDWPPPGMVETAWYLRSGEHGGALSTGRPTSAESPDAFEYDPRDPVPSLQGYLPFGAAQDQAPLEHRLLTYTSPQLERPLALIGPLRAVLYAASTAPDTDWIAKLTWVRPDGSSVVLSGAFMRARFRGSTTRPKLLQPNRPTRYELHFMPLSIVIPAGHRLRLTITSSDFPGFARNLNTATPPAEQRRPRRATNTVLHDRLRPSHIVLPVMP